MFHVVLELCLDFSLRFSQNLKSYDVLIWI